MKIKTLIAASAIMALVSCKSDKTAEAETSPKGGESAAATTNEAKTISLKVTGMQ